MDLPKSMYQMSDVMRYNGFFEGMKEKEISDKTIGYRVRYADSYAKGYVQGGIGAYLDIFSERIITDMENNNNTLEEAMRVWKQPPDRKELFEAILDEKKERLHIWGGGELEIKNIRGYLGSKGKKT